MKKQALAFSVALWIAPAMALGGGGDIPFSFTRSGGTIPDDSIRFFSLEMSSNIASITSMEMDIIGLSHTTPMDLDIYLINPFGAFIEVMTDRGEQTAVENVNLTFADNATGVPSTPLASGRYQPEGLFNETDAGFARYIGSSGGAPAVWTLVAVDDDPEGTGRFAAWTLRGTFVPEPMTLSLLAVGALVTFRRPRR